MSWVLHSEHGASGFTPTAHSTTTEQPPTPPEAPADQAWGRLIDELLRVRRFGDDWDGEGSPAPAPELVDGAIALARGLEASGHPPADRVHASVNGTVYFEWHTPSEYREIEVTSPTDAESRRVRKGSDEVEVVKLSHRS